ncbi:MAG: threonine synthase [Lachnospiraceae bacterium]|nr:threonine synthase [Lachnospiraceae bacterium]
MDILYNSTRGGSLGLTASQAVIKGLSDDGGLFVPDSLPSFDFELSELTDWDYRETAYRVMRLLLTDYTEEELRGCINKAYDSKFDSEEIAVLRKAGDQFFLELFHGRTIAFKDMALSILPHLLTTAMKKNKEDKEVVILTATSGDTGKAALSGFADVDNTRIIVFYPKGGVSRIQELQMVTEKGKNTCVVAVKGNFDDCQSKVKEIFNNVKLKQEMAEKGYVFSSANSINIGRLVPQIAYYVYAYGQLIKTGEIKAGDEVNFTVPTGNFGNILAAYYAKLLGLPVGRLICASNENKVLFDFFKDGIYDKNREFILTSSPSMDILISSNLERLIYMITGCDPQKNLELMTALSKEGRYEISSDMKARLNDFVGLYSGEQDVFNTIKSIYEKTGYVIDTHTGVAACSDLAYKKDTNDKRKSVVISTASPYKFASSVYKAIKSDSKLTDDFAIIDELSKLSGVKIPPAIEEIKNAEILHKKLCEKEKMEALVREELGI